MFLRIHIHLRKESYLKKNDSTAEVSWEREYEDDLVGEMQASEDGAKAVNAAIDRLHKNEEDKRANTD